MNMDKPSLEAIGLNARINVMKFANQHLCAPKQDDFQNYNDYEKNYDSYQAFYCYPGSRFPEWLEYKQSAKYSVIINLSSAPPSPVYGFIWCFVLVGEVNAHEFDIVISDCEGKGITDRVRMKLNHQYRLVGPHRVVVMYDQRCSDFLNNIATGLTRFKIMVAWQVKESGRSLSLPKPFNTLLGFGVSIIRTSTYSSFVQQIKEAR
ncbi:uncharacterized protein LOC106755207 [Vigna radiata var. radiata]|uniref:Uncharacterized protein LOC106755207 n=1 Tax=Vigna radiata var. radiata TaxID=3916 RepID=A0A1S3TGA7_VIGRR|nr:uncharacterized protein LOC106755207 [Vigna radiata var. radiata]